MLRTPSTMGGVAGGLGGRGGGVCLRELSKKAGFHLNLRGGGLGFLFVGGGGV